MPPLLEPLPEPPLELPELELLDPLLEPLLELVDPLPDPLELEPLLPPGHVVPPGSQPVPQLTVWQW